MDERRMRERERRGHVDKERRKRRRNNVVMSLSWSLGGIVIQVGVKRKKRGERKRKKKERGKFYTLFSGTTFVIMSSMSEYKSTICFGRCSTFSRMRWTYLLIVFSSCKNGNDKIKQF